MSEWALPMVWQLVIGIPALIVASGLFVVVVLMANDRRTKEPPRADCGDCRYCVDPTDHIPACDTPERRQP